MKSDDKVFLYGLWAIPAVTTAMLTIAFFIR